MRNNEKNLLPFHVISAATKGDTEAIGMILDHYDRYIAKLCTRQLIDENGNSHSYIDEEMRMRLKIRLIMRTLAFRIQ